MSQSYVKECIFCKNKIRMSDQMGKWLPYNENGSQHECKSKKENDVPNNRNGNNDLSVEVLLKRLDQLGVKIDLNKLRLVR